MLYEHPAVREVAVLGIPHPALGEEVAAAVAVKDGAGVSEEELREFVKTRVAAYKYPRQIAFLDGLPKGPSGKILKRSRCASEIRGTRVRGDGPGVATGGAGWGSANAGSMRCLTARR